MKKFAVAKSKTFLLIVFTLLLAVTGFFAVRSLGERNEDSFVAHADSSPTEAQLSSIGYSIVSGYTIKATDSTGTGRSTTIIFDGVTKTFTYGDHSVNILQQTVNGATYRCMFLTTGSAAPVPLWKSTSDTTGDPNYYYADIYPEWNNQLTFSSPQCCPLCELTPQGVFIILT